MFVIIVDIAICDLATLPIVLSDVYIEFHLVALKKKKSLPNTVPIHATPVARRLYKYDDSAVREYRCAVYPRGPPSVRTPGGGAGRLSECTLILLCL